MAQLPLYRTAEIGNFTVGTPKVLESFSKHIPNHVLILWDDACTLAALCINDYIHAVYDFVAQAGYCRNGFPEAGGEWVKVENRVLDDELLDKILSRKST